MDWSKVRNFPRRPEQPGPPPRIATLFRVGVEGGKPLRCASYRTAVDGYVELRLEFDGRPDELIQTRMFREVDDDLLAEEAAEWRGRLDALGYYDLAV